MRIHYKTLVAPIAPIAALVVLAYVQWATVGLPAIPSGRSAVEAASTPNGFPAWLRIGHYVNFFFLVLLIRSGLQILMDHPRLYWNVHSTPNSEWIRFTSDDVPTDRVWNARDDARSLSPWIGLPGYRGTVGMARHWHFLSVLFWVVNGFAFITLLFATGQWRRITPTNWRIIPDAWSVFVHYATFHIPPELDGFYRYNALQKLSYFFAVFVLGPAAILTGLSMSPALTNRFRFYPRLPGNRQIGRSLHFLTMCGFLSFISVHVLMVVITGFRRNMNHIVMGTDDDRSIGLILGLIGIGVVIAANGLANLAAWRRPRLVQHAAQALVAPVMRFLFDNAEPIAEFRRDEVSPYFWTNGKLPTCDEWRALAANGFHDYRLRVYGLIENPVELSLDDLTAMTKKTQVTLHHCIQGWSGIAEWGGVASPTLLDLVKPKPEARFAVFYSFGEGPDGGDYYDSQPIEHLKHSQCLLAYEMNDAPLEIRHGAPLRLRVENQLGFKMVKWIRAIEFVTEVRSIGKGEGGYKEDHEYFGESANI
jgi:sulfoxide reductase catalytic subunit YedY